MDKFGQKVITIAGKNIVLPRSETCRVTNRETEIVEMKKSNGYSYEIVPYVSEHLFSNNESLLLVKRTIWKKLLKHNTNYEECYIHFLKSGLEKLGLNIGAILDPFIIEVRNSMFEYIVFYSDITAIPTANFIAAASGESLKMSDRTGYVILSSWKKWLGF
ncbi:MAG: hypothetical protein GWP10_13445 [Nitrospiraceae bacterium]|nr:hypothetical protein [Nitrospiraceae bacterium]